MEDFAMLKAEIAAQDLYRRTPMYYGIYFALVVFGIVVSLFVITISKNPGVQLVNALWLGFWLVQSGMLGHDLSHSQVFTTERANRTTSMLVWGLLTGASESKWFEKHNAHHKYVNQIDHDPELDIPFLFSDKQLADRSDFFKTYMLPRQHVLFFAFLPLVYLGIHSQSFKHIFKHPSGRSFIELVLILAHFGILLYLLFAFLPVYLAITFFVVHALFGGLYMSLVFSPNHKGEEVIAADQKITWINQITSTRNLHPSWVSFHLLGGLNHQIEHHLFPYLPRMHFRAAQKIVKAFCARNGISYHETTWLGSLVEIYTSLKREARSQVAQLSTVHP